MGWASGKNSVAICDRCGWKYPYKELKTETLGIRVCETCDDGAFNIIDHPQNYPADVSEDVALRYPRPDVALSTTADWEPSDSTADPKGDNS